MLDATAELTHNMENVLKLAKSGAAESSSKALKEIYKDFYTSELTYASDACTGTADMAIVYSKSFCISDLFKEPGSKTTYLSANMLVSVDRAS